MTASTPPAPTSPAPTPPATLGPVPARFALVSGVLGLVANTMFVAFWLITQPYYFDSDLGVAGTRE